MPRLAALSVDLDEIGCYSAIHGLEAPNDDAAFAIYRRAVPRFRSLFADLEIDATFFAIGADLTGEVGSENGPKLRDLAEQGHEIANHTFGHRYDLTRLDRETIRDEIVRGMNAVEAATGRHPVGFRAPGYTITDEVFDVLRDLEVGYDSSVFPCPSYYSAKALAIGAIQLRGRRSHSVVDDPRVLLAPADPYRVGRPYRTRGDGLFEIPIGVTRAARLPYIGTSVVLSGEIGARWLTKAMVGRPLVNLELHGIDLADRDSDGLGFLAPHQPDLRKTAIQKEAALREAIGELRAAGYTFVTLEEAASELG